ncbi:dialkylrecorsinol condensing enzyme DarA [Flavobacterium sp. N2270]|uniref:dialkylrecorsinol condensing enzyme DarA n=1 Tax=Flavobacterium sp. N2270 TaxID=2986831 RepID=UPI0022258312|nr:dialkylrecorsinol condensing enzyme DarA [Flavobacterium sp. N2270]
MKNILVVYYTQSGQLEDIVKSITKPFQQEDEVSITYYQIKMENEFPFPWSKTAFFDAFPESFLQKEAAIVPPSQDILSKKYDLVLLGYQVWYLSPSIPINSFLKSSFAKNILNNVPVITIIGCRNMWVMAQEKMKELLKSTNSKLVGNIALVDRSINHISVITIVQWMFTGVKKKYLGIFPKPGVSDKDIQEASKFGAIIKKHLKNSHFEGLQNDLVKENAVMIHPFLVEMDTKANKMFKIWANFIINRKKSRNLLLKAFNIYLLVAIWLISPIVYILHLLLYPFKMNKIKKQTAYFKGV